MAKNRAGIQAFSDQTAAHLRMTMLAGIACAAANGSVAITGFSVGGGDGLFECFYFGGTAANHGQVTPASLSVVKGTTRLQIATQITTNKKLQLWWWDRKP